MILIIVLYALLASTFVFAKKAIGYASPCFLIGFRSILSGFVLLSYHYFRSNRGLNIKREDWWLFFKTAVVHIYITYVFEFWALRYVTALKSTLIFSATPFIAAILSYFLLKERLSKKQWGGITVGLSGLIPVIVAEAPSSEAAMELATVSLPEIVLFAAVTSGAYAWFLVKRLMAKGYSLSLINGSAMLIGGILAMLTASLAEDLSNPVSEWLPFLGWLSLLIIVANVIFYNLYGFLLRRYTITHLTFAGFLCPGFGALYAWLFTGRDLTWHYGVSLLLVAAGLYIFTNQKLFRGKQAQTK